MPKYIAKNKVVSSEVDPSVKTPSGKEVLMVVFENGVKELIPKATFDLFSTPKEVDLTSFRDLKHEHIAREMLALMAEYNIKVADIENLIALIRDAVQDYISRADSYLWTNDDNQFIPGVSAIQDRTLLEAKKVLESMPKQDGGNEEK